MANLTRKAAIETALNRATYGPGKEIREQCSPPVAAECAYDLGRAAGIAEGFRLGLREEYSEAREAVARLIKRWGWAK